MKMCGIFGTSGMARETGDIACELGLQPIYVARDQIELDAWAYPWDVVLEKDVERFRDIEFAIGIGDNAVRRKVAQRFAGQLRFTNLIHPSATFGKGQRSIIEAQQGIIVCAGVRFTNNIQIGGFGIFNLNVTISHDVVIGDFVYIAPGAHITGNVRIENGCWIGAGAVINQGNSHAKLQIGTGTIVGSGAVVNKNCDPNAVYVGIPAKRIK
jgi:sugar O-acyltransferase (sialic acid O-acetyltransferase NeuD family)